MYQMNENEKSSLKQTIKKTKTKEAKKKETNKQKITTRQLILIIVCSLNNVKGQY